jgi:hypothetical protein
MVEYTCIPNTQEVKAGGFWVQGQPGLHSETLSQQKKKEGKNSGKAQVDLVGAKRWHKAAAQESYDYLHGM